MVYEYLGLPGSGKTYLINNDSRKKILNGGKCITLENLNQKFSEMNFMLKIILNLYALIFKSDIIILSKIVFSNRSISKKILFLKIYINRHRALNLFCSKFREQTLLLDEGISNFFLNLYSLNYSNSLFVSKFYKFYKAHGIKADDVVIMIIHSNVDLCFNRLETRNEGWPYSYKKSDSRVKRMFLLDLEKRIKLLEENILKSNLKYEIRENMANTV